MELHDLHYEVAGLGHHHHPPGSFPVGNLRPITLSDWKLKVRTTCSAVDTIQTQPLRLLCSKVEVAMETLTDSWLWGQLLS